MTIVKFSETLSVAKKGECLLIIKEFIVDDIFDWSTSKKFTVLFRHWVLKSGDP